MIVSSIPLFVTYRKFINYTGELKTELKDDLHDGWDSRYNVAQRDSLIRWLLEVRIAKNVKPYIISGDIHAGGIAEIWYDDETNNQLCFAERKQDRRVLAYEIVASGLNHETLNQGGVFANLYSKAKKQAKDLRVNDNLMEHMTANGKNYSIDNFFRAYDNNLNFGAIRFTPGKTFLHTFLFSYQKSDHVQELIVEAEWDKTEVMDRKHYKIRNSSCDKFNYLPPLPQMRRNIYVSKNW